MVGLEVIGLEVVGLEVEGLPFIDFWVNGKWRLLSKLSVSILCEYIYNS